MEQTSASFKCFQKDSEHREAFKRAAKQSITRASASGLLDTSRASGIIECRRLRSASGLGNADKPTSAGIGSEQRLGLVNHVVG